jgi:hypothetical protein
LGAIASRVALAEGAAAPPHSMAAVRSRGALPITLTEESAIAAAAMTADKTRPNAA